MIGRYPSARAHLFLALSWPMLALVGCGGLERFEYETAAMGTRFRLVLYASDPERAAAAAEAAFELIAALDARLSDYDPDSELSRLSRHSDELAPTGWVEVSPDLMAVLAAGQRLAVDTDGAFDVTVGPYVRLWRRAVRQEEHPSPRRLGEARASVGLRRLELDESGGTARLLAPGMRIDLGGIAKGYALDRVLALLEEHGIERALIDGGGDVAVSGPPPDRAAWRVAIPPGDGGGTRYVALAHGAVASSGDAYRFVEIDGVRYSHLVDPRTGVGLTGSTAATVVAPTGMDADALASAVCVLGLDKGPALLEAATGTEGRLLAEGREVVSAGFSTLLID